MNITLDEMKANLLAEELKSLFHQAYESGLSDARREREYPPTLRKEHLAEIFQVALPTVEKIIRCEGFPRFKAVAARYPRDEVFDWMKTNTERMNERLGEYLDLDEMKQVSGR